MSRRTDISNGRRSIIHKPRLTPIEIDWRFPLISRKRLLITSRPIALGYLFAGIALAVSPYFCSPFLISAFELSFLVALYYIGAFLIVDLKYRSIVLFPLALGPLFILYTSIHIMSPIALLLHLAVIYFFLRIFPLPSIIGISAAISLLIITHHYDYLPCDTAEQIKDNAYITSLIAGEHNDNGLLLSPVIGRVDCIPRDIQLDLKGEYAYASCVPAKKDQRPMSYDFVSIISFPLQGTGPIVTAQIGQLEGLAYLEDDQLLATMYFDDKLLWIDPHTLSTLKELPTEIDSPQLITSIGNGRYVIANEFGTGIIFDTAENTQQVFSGAPGGISYQLSPDGKFLWMAHLMGPLFTTVDVSRTNIESLEMVSNVSLEGHMFFTTCYDSKQNILLVTEAWHGILYGLDPENLTVVKKLRTEKCARIVEYDSARNLIYLAGFLWDKLIVLDGESWNEMARISIGGSTRDIVIGPTGRVLIANAAGILELEIDAILGDLKRQAKK